MLAPNKRRVPEAFPAPLLRPGGGPQSDWVSGDNSLSGAKALVRGVSTQFSEGRNARKSAGLSKADQRDTDEVLANHTGAHEAPDARPWRRLDLPHGIEGVLELAVIFDLKRGWPLQELGRASCHALSLRLRHTGNFRARY